MAYINKGHPDFIGPKLLLSKERIEPKTKYDEIEPPKKSSGGGILSFIFGSKENKPPSPEKKETNFEEVFDKINEREKTQIRIMRQLLDSYFTIVKKNVQDRVTKTIMHFLVLNSINSLQEVLHINIYKQGDPSAIAELLKEAGDIAIKRKVCQKELQALKHAKKVLGEVIDL